MSYCSKRLTWLIMLLSISSELRAYEFLCQDDGLMCSGGNPLERYHQRIQQNAYEQRAIFVENQHAIAYQTALELRSREMSKMARRARFEREARHRDEAIAKRKAEKIASSVPLSASTQASDKTLKQSK